MAAGCDVTAAAAGWTDKPATVVVTISAEANCGVITATLGEADCGGESAGIVTAGAADARDAADHVVVVAAASGAAMVAPEWLRPATFVVGAGAGVDAAESILLGFTTVECRPADCPRCAGRRAGVPGSGAVTASVGVASLDAEVAAVTVEAATGVVAAGATLFGAVGLLTEWRPVVGRAEFVGEASADAEAVESAQAKPAVPMATTMPIPSAAASPLTRPMQVGVPKFFLNESRFAEGNSTAGLLLFLST